MYVQVPGNYRVLGEILTAKAKKEGKREADPFLL
jgi:hypothetical protein